MTKLCGQKIMYISIICTDIFHTQQSIYIILRVGSHTDHNFADNAHLALKLGKINLKIVWIDKWISSFIGNKILSLFLFFALSYFHVEQSELFNNIFHHSKLSFCVKHEWIIYLSHEAFLRPSISNNMSWRFRWLLKKWLFRPETHMERIKIFCTNYPNSGPGSNSISWT